MSAMKKEVLKCAFWAMALLAAIFGTAVACSAAPVIYDFGFMGCPYCRQMDPVVQQLANEGYTVYKIDRDKYPELVAKYGVDLFPTFVWVEDGREIHRECGAVSVERLRWGKRVVEREKITTTKKRLLTSVYPVGRETRPAAAIKRNPAVVRIYSQLPGGKMLKGTGAIVRWHGRVCIVTVWHVVHDAKKITVWIAAKGRPGYYRARLVKTDPAFDGAVLEVTGLADSDAPAAEVAIGQAAIPQSGDALVYAGFGSDETYLEKTGTFIGYRGLPGQQMWDFMAISGNARNGDSGAPIFNKDGRLVGCLSDDNRPEWRGRPGAGRPMLGRGQAPEIQAIQPGRIHKLLDQAVGQ